VQAEPRGQSIRDRIFAEHTLTLSDTGASPAGCGPKGIRRDRVKAHAPGNMFLILLDAVHGNLGLIALRLPEAAAR
jgi:hypothetical protein